jgi:probable F420-dependent oxidoreductase
MELGFSTMNTPEDVRPDVLARELEDRGYTSLFIGEHSHIPASRRTPYPSGGEMPDQYRRMMDPFVSLTMAAAASERLHLGLGVCLVLEHHVLDLAKAVATLDLLSGGRVLFGVGVGWNAEELENHRPDITWALRYRASEECVAALRACWTDDESSFHGEFFDFESVWSFPKPAQRPHPPVLLGTGGKLGTQHAVRWADEWMPMDIALGGPVPNGVAKKVTRFREIAAGQGRDIPISLVTFGDPTLETLHHYRELGIVRTIIGASRQGWDEPATTIPFLDRYADLIPDLAA